LAFDVVVLGLRHAGLRSLWEERSPVPCSGLRRRRAIRGRAVRRYRNVAEISDADVNRALQAGSAPTTDAPALGDASVIMVATPIVDRAPDL
jgi:hypothetical protein